MMTETVVAVELSQNPDDEAAAAAIAVPDSREVDELEGGLGTSERSIRIAPKQLVPRWGSRSLSKHSTGLRRSAERSYRRMGTSKLSH